MPLMGMYRRVMARPLLVGYLSAILAAVCYGMGTYLSRKLVATEAPPMVVATYGLLAGTLILGMVSVPDIIKDIHAPRKAFVLASVAGLLATGGVAFMLYGLSLAPVVVVAPITAINPLISLALAHFFLQRLERVTLRIWIGGIMVVAGVVVVTLSTA